MAVHNLSAARVVDCRLPDGFGAHNGASYDCPDCGLRWRYQARGGWKISRAAAAMSGCDTRGYAKPNLQPPSGDDAETDVESVVLPAVTEPGIYYDMPEDVYHADPTPGSLSVSAAKLLAKSPGHFRHAMDTPREPKTVWDEGHAVHTLTLGSGAPIIEIEAADWRTSGARSARDTARAQGGIPLLTTQVQAAKRMADAVHSHATAAGLLAEGVPEVSMFGIDEPTGAWIRGRIDWLTSDGTLVDLKTTTDAAPDRFGRKSVPDFGYHQQAAWYLDLARALDLPANDFVFICVEKTGHHPVSVIRLDDDYLELGRQANRHAIDLWNACRTSGIWPSYPDPVVTVSPPAWMLPKSTHLDASVEAELLELLSK